MNTKLNLEVTRQDKPSSISEISKLYSVTENQELKAIANFLSLVPLVCPTKVLKIFAQRPHIHAVLDNYLIDFLDATRIKIMKGNAMFTTSPHRVLEFLSRSKSEYPYSRDVVRVLDMTVPRLIETNFLLIKKDDSIKISYS